MMTEITEGSFYRKCQDFLTRNPHEWLMARPDRPIDQPKNRYRSNGDRLRGDEALKNWLDYFSAKGLRSYLRTWPSLILTGHSLQLPCPKPEIFDLSYVPAGPTSAGKEFWSRLRAERLEKPPRLTDEQIAARRAKADKIAAEFAKNGNPTGKPKPKIGDSQTPAEAIPWEERERLYRENPSKLSEYASRTGCGAPWQENMDGEVSG